MIRHSKNQRGAVLVVALIMLAMLTFLTVAFVGFARFERASVTAALKRTDQDFAARQGLAMAVSDVVRGVTNLTNQAPMGLQVSQRPDVNGLLPPVHLDTNSDGLQDRNSTYLDLNAETNATPNPVTPPLDDPWRFQKADNSGSVPGDPEWIGLLQNNQEPHGLNNRYIARVAYMVVPLRQALNVRYHHDLEPLTTTVRAPVQRGQGGRANAINLDAPLYHLDPILFRAVNPGPYAGSFYGLGGAIDDAIKISRPDTLYNRVKELGRVRGQGLVYEAVGEMDVFEKWFGHSVPRGTTNRFYRFMETFSAVPLPDDDTRFDVSQIRDETVQHFAVSLYNGMGGKDSWESLSPHKLKAGSRLTYEYGGAKTWDPIDFDLQTGGNPADDWGSFLGSGEFTTAFPSRLRVNDPVEIRIPKGKDNLRLVFFNANAGQYVEFPKLGEGETHIQFQAKVINVQGNSVNVQLTLNSPGLNPDKFFWGQFINGSWLPQYNLKFGSTQTPDIPGQMPAGFLDDGGDVSPAIQLRYRNSIHASNQVREQQLDKIPYFVKPIDEYSFMIHRSAALDSESSVNIAHPSLSPGNDSVWGNDDDGRPVRDVNEYSYNAGNGKFSPVNAAMKFPNGALVRFSSKNRNDQVNGIPFPSWQKGQDTIYANKATAYIINGSFSDGYELLLGGAAIRFNGPPRIYQLEQVHRFDQDLLVESVEQMAGLMINESLDIDINGTPPRHILGGGGLPIPDPASPFPLKIGIGGNHRPKGLWHDTGSGIPWGNGDLQFPERGSYTPEIERIMQVAANIGDLFSESGQIYIRKNDVVSFRESMASNGTGMVYWGRQRSEGEVGANLDYVIEGIPQGNVNFASPISFGGIGLGGIRAFFKPTDFSALPGKGASKDIPGRVFIQKYDPRVGWADLAKSNELKTGLRVYSSYDEFVKKDIYRAECQLRIRLERGRDVKVLFNGRDVLGYEMVERLGDGRSFLFAENTRLKSTQVHPRMRTGQISGDSQDGDSPKVFDKVIQPSLINGSAEWLYDSNSNVAQTLGWFVGYNGVGYSKLPTALQGVFSRDARDNKVSLSGFQRVSAFHEASWYQREAPRVIGTKVHRLANGYNYRMPAINEVSLRLEYQRDQNSLWGRIGLELDVPSEFRNGNCAIKINSLGLEGVFDPIYKLSKGAAEVSGGAQPFSESINPLLVTVLRPGRFFATPIPKLFKLSSSPIDRTIPNPNGVGRLGLCDIDVTNLRVKADIEIIDTNTNRSIDFFDGVLTEAMLSPAAIRFTSASDFPSHEFFAPVWRPMSGLQVGDVVLHPNNNDYYKMRQLTADPPGPGSSWLKLERGYRKIDVSWQVNDPLVNSSERGWRGRVYGVRTTIPSNPNFPIGNGESRFWSSSRMKANPFDGSLPATSSPSRPWTVINLGENLYWPNELSHPWGTTGVMNNSAIKDPGTQFPLLGNVPGNYPGKWVFPNLVNTGGPQNSGWLGQVHRGTPWQTLYLKSDDSVTAQEWVSWSGSPDTRPINDHRLIEALTVRNNESMRGRFDINNLNHAAWSGLFEGVSLPRREASNAGVGVVTGPRRLGAGPGAGGIEAKISTKNDPRFITVLDAITNTKNTLGNMGRFTRASDILKVPQLTEQSPYLNDVVSGGYNSSSLADDIDLERIPQQLLSILRVGGRQFYQAYVFTELLQPAQRDNIDGKEKPAIRAGNIYNYRVTSSQAQRIVFELVGAEGWHESLKRGHFGKSRNANGGLEDLSMPRPKVLGEWPIRLDY